MWQRKVRWSPYNYQVLSNSYVIQMTGGSITIMDRPSMSVLERHTGHKALYTGDIHPDESVCAALEFFTNREEKVEKCRKIKDFGKDRTNLAKS